MMTREQAVDLVTEFLARFSAMEFGRLGELMADDVIVEMPYTPGSTVHHGRAECVAYLDRSVRSFVKQVKFTITDTLFDPARQAILVDHRNDGVRVDGRTYHNRYLGIFDLADGRIVRWQQFLNPALL